MVPTPRERRQPASQFIVFAINAPLGFSSTDRKAHQAIPRGPSKSADESECWKALADTDGESNKTQTRETPAIDNNNIIQCMSYEIAGCWGAYRYGFSYSCGSECLFKLGILFPA